MGSKGSKAAKKGEEPSSVDPKSDKRESIVFEDDKKSTKSKSDNAKSTTESTETSTTESTTGKASTKSKSDNAKSTTESTESSTTQSTTGKALPKRTASRLQVQTKLDPTQLKSRLDEKPKGSKMFAAQTEDQNKSRIYNALNPQKLYYESRREKEEAKEEAERVVIGSSLDNPKYNFMRDDEGNIIEDEEDDEEEEEEPFDLRTMPDYGKFQKEMDELRARREEKAEARRAELRKQHEAKKAEEERIRQEELKKIAQKEAELEKGKVEMADGFVEEAQKRLEEEVTANLKFKYEE